ncbi:MAG: M6 family metalloprotease domain-containing protein [Bacteroidales bacterium]|nr:M6 family metalloprotease domain-containing protein [Bacteroidales bacterium]
MIKKITCVLAMMVVGFATVFAAYIKDYPVSVTQPDGKILQCYATGDEYHNWLHDANHFTIIQNQETGFYCYAIKQGETVVASNYVVGTVDPASVGISAGVNISATAMKAKRDAFWKNVPDVTTLKNYQTPTGSRNIGQMNNLVVYIRFSDQSEYSQDTAFYWDMFNDVSNPQDQSMKNYFQQVSYNQLDITTHFFPFTFQPTVVSYQDSHPRGYYMPQSYSNPEGYDEYSDERNEREFQLLADAIAAIADQVPEDLDIDYNNDGNVDNVCFIIKGGTTAWATLLWPHRWSLYGREAYIHNKRVWDFNFQLSDYLINSRSSVLCHEMFHSLGSPDLYRYQDNTIDPVGPWDVMCANSNPAQSMCAYMKWKYGGWLEEIPEITEGGVYSINTPWNRENCIYKIASPNSETEYFTIEYRNRTAHAFEHDLPGSGLLIYRINTLYNGNADGPPDEVYIYRPGGTNTYNNGSINSAHFSAASGRTSFNDQTDPPCFLSNNMPGGISIRNISAIGNQMTFEVVFNTLPEADFTASQDVVTTNCGIDFYGESYNVVDEWHWEFQDGSPATSNEQNPTGIVFTSTGEKNISLTVTNNNGSTTTTKQNFINVSASLKPITDFNTFEKAVCPNVPVYFYDSTTLCPIAWQWTFSPNTVSFLEGTSASSQNPVVQFEEVTEYTVSLTATNSNGSTTATKENYITTIGRNPLECNVDFSDINSFEEIGWKVENVGNNNLTWDLYTFENQKKAARMNFYGNTQLLQKDYLILPIMNFDAPYKMYFSHAYAMSSSNYSDSLYVAVSTDCGETWTREAAFAENLSYNFATAPRQNSPFIPNENQWCGNNITNTPCNEVDLSKYSDRETVMVRFEAVRATGNNLYISDVSFKDCTGIGEVADETSIIIYPNPGKGIYTIYNEDFSGTADIKVFNTLGKMVWQQQTSNAYTTLNLEHQFSGIYFVVVTTENSTKTLKIIKM